MRSSPLRLFFSIYDANVGHCCRAPTAQGAVIRNYYSASCGCQPCQFIVGFGNPAAPGVKYCDCANNPSVCIPDDNTFKGDHQDVQPPVAVARDAAPKGGIYITRRGMTVAFGEDFAPGTAIKHAQKRRATLRARAAEGALAALEKRQDDCDQGDGDEDDASPDNKKRSTRADAYGMPEYEFVDDEIAYKME